MKTTLVIDDTVIARVKREAAERGCTMSQVVESALRLHFYRPHSPQRLAPLPSFDMGEPLVDIADRDALYDAMEKDRWRPLTRT
jgi:hypothetical protein